MILLMGALQVPAVTVLFKYVPSNLYWFIYAFWICCFIAYYWIAQVQDSGTSLIIKAINTKWLLFLWIGIMGVVSFYWYPILDARKVLLLGSDQDDAIVLVVKALFSGDSPYAVRTYLGNSPSPGPGIVLLLSPFVFLNIYALITPVFVAILGFMVYRKTKSTATVGVLLLLLASSPAFWKLMTNGSDLIVVGILMTLPLLVHFEWKNHTKNWILLIGIGTILTSRILFIYLAPLYAYLLLNGADRSFKRWLMLSAGIGVVTLSIHGLFLGIDPENYGPLHLIDRGYRIFSWPVVLTLIPILGISVWWTTLNRKDPNWAIYQLWYWLVMVLSAIVISEIYSGFLPLKDHPLSHLGVQLPVLATYAALSIGIELEKKCILKI